MSSTDARAVREELERLLGAHPWPLPPGFADGIERYVALLLGENRRQNLTRVTEPAAVARVHLLDALAALPILDELGAERAIDLGSGGGIPGLVLALARPAVTWTLVDSERRKAGALRTFAGALGLENVVVVAARAELVGRDASHRERHQLVTARACAALPILAEYALPLLLPGGRLLAWKGRVADDELAAGEEAAAELGGSAPTLRAAGHEALGDRRFVLVTKVDATPERYPRRPGVPARRPLGRG